MLVLTREQREALFRVFQRDFPSWITPTRRHSGTYCPHCHNWSGAIVRVPSLQWRAFRKNVRPYLGDNNCVMLPWKGMWLGIERDGYVHS